MLRKTFFYTLFSVLMALSLVSCQSSPKIDGTYTTNLSAENLPADLGLPPEFMDFISGQWEMTLADGKVTIAKDGEMMVEGTYYANKDKVTFTDTGGPASATTAEEATGEYQWKLEGNQLTFTALNDLSMGRQLVLTTSPWIKK